VIEARRRQFSFADGLIAEEVSDLWEDWMRPADQVLDDEQLLTTVYEALAKRHPKSRTRGRPGTPAEVVLRLLLLKQIRNWSYEVVEREVRANLVYRSCNGPRSFPSKVSRYFRADFSDSAVSWSAGCLTAAG